MTQKWLPSFSVVGFGVVVSSIVVGSGFGVNFSKKHEPDGLMLF